MVKLMFRSIILFLCILLLPLSFAYAENLTDIMSKYELLKMREPLLNMSSECLTKSLFAKGDKSAVYETVGEYSYQLASDILNTLYIVKLADGYNDPQQGYAIVEQYISNIIRANGEYNSKNLDIFLSRDNIGIDAINDTAQLKKYLRTSLEAFNDILETVKQKLESEQ